MLKHHTLMHVHHSRIQLCLYNGWSGKLVQAVFPRYHTKSIYVYIIVLLCDMHFICSCASIFLVCLCVCVFGCDSKLYFWAYYEKTTSKSRPATSMLDCNLTKPNHISQEAKHQHHHHHHHHHQEQTPTINPGPIHPKAPSKLGTVMTP